MGPRAVGLCMLGEGQCRGELGGVPMKQTDIGLDTEQMVDDSSLISRTGWTKRI